MYICKMMMRNMNVNITNVKYKSLETLNKYMSEAGELRGQGVWRMQGKCEQELGIECPFGYLAMGR